MTREYETGRNGMQPQCDNIRGVTPQADTTVINISGGVQPGVSPGHTSETGRGPKPPEGN